MLVFAGLNLLVEVQVSPLRVGGYNAYLNKAVSILIYTQDVVVLLGSETVKRHNLDQDLTSKYQKSLEDEALTFASTRNKEDVVLAEDSSVYYIDLYRLQYSVYAIVEELEHTLQASLDNLVLVVDRFLVLASIEHKLLYLDY